MHSRLRPSTTALILVIAALVLVPAAAFAADRKPRPVPPPPPPPPTITLTTAGTTFVAPAIITLTATVSPNDGRIESVRFRNGSRRIGPIDRAAPYTMEWRKATPGVYTLTAVGRGKKGLKVESAPVVITITAPAPPPPPPPPPPPNVAPSVSLAADMTTFTTSQTMTLTATATDSDGTVARVDFYQGSTLLHTSAGPAHTASFSSPTAGTFVFTAVAIDNLDKASAPSNEVTATVSADTPPDPATQPLVQPPNLVYAGSFRVPAGGSGSATFEYGGTALAFKPDPSNPGGGSLFVVGHDHGQMVTEISIPAVAPGIPLENLPTASTIQPFTEATEGRIYTVNPESPNPVKIGGLLPYDDRLYITAYDYYDGGETQYVSHFWSGLNLGTLGDINGPYRVTYCSPGNPDDCLNSGYLNGYFGLVPPEWQEPLGGPVLNGNCCLSVIGRTSYGPAVFTLDPADMGPAPLVANALVYYWFEHPLLDDQASPGVDGCFTTSTLFNCTSQVRGVVFPEGSRSVLFFGRHGVGPFCYGAGTTDASLHGQPVPNEPGVIYCHDPVDDGKGTHGYPYAHYVWAYDANDLAGVKNGQTLPWDVKPYSAWRLDLPFDTTFGMPGDSSNRQLGGATYDAATQRIFVSQMFGEGRLPVIHVFTVQ